MDSRLRPPLPSASGGGIRMDSRLRPLLSSASGEDQSPPHHENPTSPFSPLHTDGRVIEHPTVSLLRPPLLEPGSPIPSVPNVAGERAIAPSISHLSREESVRSPAQSPSRDAGNPIYHRIPQAITQLVREGSVGSPVRSPLREAAAVSPNRLSLLGLPKDTPENPSPHRIPLVTQLAREGSMGSPVWPETAAGSPNRLLVPEIPIPNRLAREGSKGSLVTAAGSPNRLPENPIPHKISLVTQLAREGSMGSPVTTPGSPDVLPENPIPHRIPLVTQLVREGSMGSPVRSPLREKALGSPNMLQNPTPHRSPLVTQLSAEESIGSPAQSQLREAVVESPNRLALVPVSLSAVSPKETLEKLAPPPAAEAVSNHLLQDEKSVLSKNEGFEGGRGKCEGYSSGLLDQSEVVSGIVRRKAVRRALLGLRVSGLVLSLISFSVMAANKTVGWAGDSFDRYIEYRYLVSVNVIVFVYSGFQAYSQVHHMITNKYLIRCPVRYYFDFSMDQVLAYLLMSVSSSAAACNDEWVSMYGSDDFTIMANASIAMSFLAFIALALTSLVSAYNLFRQTI